MYGQYSTQKEVFDESIVPIINEVLTGFNCTVFAYGQTGTGKTHTMEGELGTGEQAGIIPRSLNFIFDSLPRSCTEYSVRLSFVELYNEVGRDVCHSETRLDFSPPSRANLCNVECLFLWKCCFLARGRDRGG